MKKLPALLLTVLFLVCFSATAFAQEAPTTNYAPPTPATTLDIDGDSSIEGELCTYCYGKIGWRYRYGDWESRLVQCTKNNSKWDSQNQRWVYYGYGCENPYCPNFDVYSQEMKREDPICFH